MKYIRLTQLVTLKILRLPAILIVMLLCTSCFNNKNLPRELNLSRVLYQEGEQHMFGPGGINQSFYVYEISKNISNKVASDGIEYLNSLPSSKKADNKKEKIYQKRIEDKDTGPYKVGFTNWQTTPVSKDKAWLRRGRDLGTGWKLSIETFLASYKGDKSNDDFISIISPAFLNSFHEAISTPGNAYAYGGYRGMSILIVVPSQRRAYYIYRD